MEATSTPYRSALAPPEPAPHATPIVRRFVARQLKRWAGRPRTVMVTVPAPAAEPESLLDLHPHLPAFLWDAGAGAAWAGVGATHRIEPDGRQRFGTLRRRAERVFRRLVVATCDGCPRLSPRFFGGLAFAAEATAARPWEELGDGGFVLPRLLYARAGRRAFLHLAVGGEELGGGAARRLCLDELEATLDALARARPALPAAGRIVAVERPSRARVTADVEAIRREIARGRAVKIVTAGCSRVELAAPVDAVAVLRRLRGVAGGATRFAFRRGAATFLGATPERLIARRGRGIATEALAGSRRPGAGRAEELLASDKDGFEHRLVVQAIVERLAPWCSRLAAPAAPRVRELAHVLHLSTPISGTLSTPRHVLELARALHPTPAVGGLPQARAARWIREREAGPRGWYAAPVGWFDARGDGELAVALRSAVISGAEAHVYAGAGIVAGSDPELEYREIELKKQTLLAALGAAS